MMNIDTDHLNQDVTLQDQNSGTGQLLTFILGGEEYGLDILNVQEIRSWEQATSIPNTPDYVLGVINLRGLIVPIIDLRNRFEMEGTEYGPLTVIIIVKLSGNSKSSRTVGMVVDEVSDVYNIAEEDIGELPDLGSVVGTEFIKGVASVKEKMVIILDIDLLIDTGVLGGDTAPDDDESQVRPAIS
jgi:purine-binding chemotaxis protein CheW